MGNENVSNLIAALAVIVAVVSVAVTVALYILSGLKAEIQNLYRIKSGISGELNAFKVEAAREFVTYPRMSTEFERHSEAFNGTVSRIEAELKVLPQLRDMITTLTTHMNIKINKTGGLGQIGD